MFHTNEKQFFKVPKMYSLVIPPELLPDLVEIRRRTGISIRRQILDSILDHIAKSGIYKRGEANA